MTRKIDPKRVAAALAKKAGKPARPKGKSGKPGKSAKPAAKPTKALSFGSYVADYFGASMGPIVLAGLYGFAKGFALSGPDEEEALSEVRGDVRGYEEEDTASAFNPHAVLVAPVIEEAAYRGPVAAGVLPPWMSAGAFALEHLRGENLRGMHAVARFADTFGGGLLYARAAQSSGLPAAILAHAFHNLAVGLGALARRRK